MRLGRNARTERESGLVVQSGTTRAALHGPRRHHTARNEHAWPDDHFPNFAIAFGRLTSKQLDLCSHRCDAMPWAELKFASGCYEYRMARRFAQAAPCV